MWGRDHVELQDRQNDLPGVRDARRRAVELLAALSPVVDLGSGTGSGAEQLGPHALAFDSSAVMTGESARRGIPTCRADVEELPIRTNSLGGVRCDRVLYHLHQPERALAEAVRVTSPGGRIVCTHPDYESMMIDVPGAPEHLVALTKSTRIELNYRSGTVPRRLPKMLLDLGVTDVHTEMFTVVVEDIDDSTYALPRWLRQWRDAGAVDVSDGELQAWDEALEAGRRDGRSSFTLTYLLTYGTVA